MIKHKKEVSYGVRFVRNKFTQIATNKFSRHQAINELKKELDYPDLCIAIDFLSRNLSDKPLEGIWGIPLPKDYSQIGSLKEVISARKPDRLFDEIKQYLINIREYSYEINLFLKYKEEYESNLLVGKYSEAEKILSLIEKDICCSLWSLENRFLLKEASGNASENKEFLSSFNDLNENSGVTQSLAHFLSLRVEHSLSVNRFLNDLSISLDKITGPYKNANQEYYKFKLLFLNCLNFNDYTNILAFDFSHSVIDRYLTLIKVFSSLLIVSNYLKDHEGVLFGSQLKTYLLNRTNYLIRKVNDPQLYKLKLLAGEEIFPAFDVKKCREEIQIIDKYTSGLYSDVEEDIKHHLIKKPYQFDLYVIYIKSLIYQNKDFIPIAKENSFQNQILSNLFQIISVNGNPDQFSMNLLRIANNLASSNISYGITDFVHNHIEGKQERNLLSKLTYSFSNPIVYDVFSSQERQLDFIELLSTIYPESITIELFKERIKGDGDILKFKKQIPNGRFKIEYARQLQGNSNYIDASKEWEELIRDYKDTPPIYEIALINLFECYLKLDKIDDCIKIYVDSYFNNNYIIEKIETKEILQIIRSNKFKNVSKSIELPIFYTIIDADDIETHIAFEQFNLYNGVKKPSQLIEKSTNFEDKKINFFFEFCCSSKVLMHSIFIESSKDRLEERLILAKFIKSMDSENKNISAEIKSIENILVIQQGLIDLDESKIYVNEQGIIDNELQDYEAIYERFEIIAGISGKKKLLFLGGSGKLTTLSQDEKIEYSSNPVFDIYLELFEVIKDKFLNSQFGIVSYLSTRIRHGVLVGEIRPIFENHKLITLKEGTSSSYRRNYHWDFIYNHLPDVEKNQLQELLKEFSSQVDGLIFDLIKKHLQVFKHEINEEGWFNYDFTTEELFLEPFIAIKNSSDFEDFIRGVFEILWIRTDQNLENIRDKINSDILGKFNTYFNELELKLTTQFGSVTAAHEIIKAIKDCSTEVQVVIQKISRWFKRSEIKASDFRLDDLVALIIESTNKTSYSKKLSVEQSIDVDILIKGEYKTHLADLLRIFFENIIKHSNDKLRLIKSSITAFEKANRLIIKIQNEIENIHELETLENLWNSYDIEVSKLRSEGKSGYPKAFKILKSDLKSPAKDNLTTNIIRDDCVFEVIIKINIDNLKA